MSELKTKLLLEKLEIESHIEVLEKEIADLEQTRAHRDHFHYKPESTEERTTKPEDVNFQKMDTLIKLSSSVCGMHFDRVEQYPINSNEHVLRGVGSAEEIIFDFQVVIAKPLIVQSVLLKFEDEKLEKELNPWKKKYIKKKNFQVLMQGISLYSSLMRRMKEILNWLSDTYPTLLMIESQDLSGSVVKSIKNNEEDGEPMIRVLWKIKWLEADFIMLDRFVIDISDVDTVTLETRTNWKKFLSAKKYSVDDLKQFWIAIVDELLG